jgi:hypothetical protein
MYTTGLIKYIAAEDLDGQAVVLGEAEDGAVAQPVRLDCGAAQVSLAPAGVRHARVVLVVGGRGQCAGHGSSFLVGSCVVGRALSVRGSAQKSVSAAGRGAQLSVALSPDGRLLASCSWNDGAVWLWDPIAGNAFRAQ